MSDKTDEQMNKQIIWDLDRSDPQLAETLRESLRDVIDPEIGLNVIELGLIRNAKLSDDHAEIIMILTTPFCPYGPAMLEMTRKKAEENLKIPTTIEMGMEMWDFSMMEEGAGGDWGIF